LVGVDFGWDVEKGSDKEEVKSGTDDEFSSFEDGDEVFKIFFPIQNLYVRTPRRFDFTQTPFRRPLSVFASVRPPPSPFSRGTNGTFLSQLFMKFFNLFLNFIQISFFLCTDSDDIGYSQVVVVREGEVGFVFFSFYVEFVHD